MYLAVLLLGIGAIGCDRADEPDTETVIIKEEPAPATQEKDPDTKIDVKIDRDKGVEFGLEKDNDK